MALTSQQVKGQKKLHFSVYKTALAVVFLASFEVQGIFDQDPKESEEGPESSFLRVDMDITNWPCFRFNKESFLGLFGTTKSSTFIKKTFIKLRHLVQHVQFQNGPGQFEVAFRGQDVAFDDLEKDQRGFQRHAHGEGVGFYYQRRRLGQLGKKFINNFVVFFGADEVADEIVGVLQWRPDDQIKVYLNNNRKRGDVGLMDVFVNEKLKLKESNEKLEESNSKLKESNSKLEESKKKLEKLKKKLEEKLKFKEEDINELKNELNELKKKDINELNKKLEEENINLKKDIRKHQDIRKEIQQLLSINE